MFQDERNLCIIPVAIFQVDHAGLSHLWLTACVAVVGDGPDDFFIRILLETRLRVLAFLFAIQVPDLSFGCCHPLQRGLNQINTLPATRLGSQPHPTPLFQRFWFISITDHLGCLNFLFLALYIPIHMSSNSPIQCEPWKP